MVEQANMVVAKKSVWLKLTVWLVAEDCDAEMQNLYDDGDDSSLWGVGGNAFGIVLVVCT